VPIAQTNGSESLMAVVDGKIIDFRVPYPLGFFTKNVDGRIDDPQAGWKGRAMWTTSGTRTNFHNEGGTDNRPRSTSCSCGPIRSRGKPLSPAEKVPAIQRDRLGAILLGDCARRVQWRRLVRGGVRHAHSIRRIPALRGAGRGGDYQKQNEGRAHCELLRRPSVWRRMMAPLSPEEGS